MRSAGLLFVYAAMLSGQRVTTVKLTPGVTTALKHNPVGLRETFAVAASAGETLFVELRIAGESYAREDRLQVSGPGNTIVKPAPDADPPVDWIGLLPQSGTYFVTVTRAVKTPYVLRLTLMEPHDPRIYLGLEASQISMPAVPEKIDWKHQIFWPPIPDLAEFGRDRLEALIGTMSVSVMRVEGFKKTWGAEDDGAKRVARLEAALKSGVVTGSPADLPGQAGENAELVFFAARRVIRGPGLRAVRWVGAWDQTNSGPVDPIAYGADGITPDGQYFVRIRALASHPALPDAAHTPDRDEKQLKDFRAKMANTLDSAPPASFTPSLDKLDEIVRSFAVR